MASTVKRGVPLPGLHSKLSALLLRVIVSSSRRLKVPDLLSVIHRLAVCVDLKELSLPA